MSVRKLPLPILANQEIESYGCTCMLVYLCKSSCASLHHPHVFTLGQIQSTLLKAQGALRSPPSLLLRFWFSPFRSVLLHSWVRVLFLKSNSAHELSCSTTFLLPDLPAPHHMLNKAQAPTPNTEVLPRKDPNFLLRLSLLLTFFSDPNQFLDTFNIYWGILHLCQALCWGLHIQKLKHDLDWLLVV